MKKLIALIILISSYTNAQFYEVEYETQIKVKYNEKGFGLLVTGFDAFFEQLGHGGAVLLTGHYAATAAGVPSHRSAHSQRPPCGGPWLMPQCWLNLF